ncbi:MAG: sulfite exporter TauE/SafE family protein [Chloroflexota bacterium]|nr:sulfite exporter TauE/SafE family protein [Chloroflexota bacterium]
MKIEHMTLLGAFVLGLAHTLHPCEDKGVASMIVMWAGKSMRDAIFLITLYGLGTTLINAAMGAVAAYVGSLLLLQYGRLLKTIAGAATALFGSWILSGHKGYAPVSPVEEEKLRGMTALSVFLMAIVGGLPICPFELAVLTWIASVGDVWRGILTVLAFGLGTTIGLIPWGFAIGSLGELARRGGYGAWMPKIMGALIMAMGVFIALSAWI